MRFLTLALIIPALATCAGSAHAFDAFNATTQSLVATGYASSLVSSAPFERKLLVAKDDAAAFIASDGAMRGAQLESALVYLRQAQPKLHASDLELAQAILVQ